MILLKIILIILSAVFFTGIFALLELIYIEKNFDKEPCDECTMADECKKNVAEGNPNLCDGSKPLYRDKL